MARPLRIEFSGALYHVTSRGDRREAIFDDDEDRAAFLDVLSEVITRYNWLCHAYCLITNHYHLVIETVDGNLSQGMRQLNGVYTQASNRRHQRVGHLFQGRFKGILVDVLSVPKLQRRPPAASLPAIAAGFTDRDAAVIAAYATGAYSYREIAEHFGVHLSTIGRIVRKEMLRREN